MKNKTGLLLSFVGLAIIMAAGFFLFSTPPEKESQLVEKTPVSEPEKNIQAPSPVAPEVPPTTVTSSLPAEIPSGVTDSLFPKNATEKIEKNVDFQGDGSPEKVIFYRSIDNIGNEKLRTNQHIKVLALENNEWKIVKDDLIPNDNVGVETNVAQPNVIDLGGDKKEELFVLKCSGKHCNTTYYIFAYKDGAYQDLPIPKGYLHSKEYLQPGDNFIFLRSVKANETGITEGYDVYCEAKPYGEVEFGADSAVCRRFELFLQYENGNFRVEKMNEEKVS